MCRNGQYTEHGIKGLHGFCRERFRMGVPFVVPVDPTLGISAVLVEPASIVAKAWDQIERISARSRWTPKTVLVLGAGPVGLLAALFGVLRGLDVHVLDRITSGPKPDLVRTLGAQYHVSPVSDACRGMDVVLECTGAAPLVFDAIRCAAPTGVVCLTGVTSGHRNVTVDAAMLNNELVLENNVVFGTVNANRSHYSLAADALSKSDRAWLARLITRCVRLPQWADAYQRRIGDIKTVLVFADV
jgi:threonine dehydrogenase-like Zn-dependent dehydrogenase